MGPAKSTMMHPTLLHACAIDGFFIEYAIVNEKSHPKMLRQNIEKILLTFDFILFDKTNIPIENAVIDPINVGIEYGFIFLLACCYRNP